MSKHRYRMRGVFEMELDLADEDYDCSVEEVIAAALEFPDDWATSELVMEGKLVEFEIVRVPYMESEPTP